MALDRKGSMLKPKVELTAADFHTERLPGADFENPMQIGVDDGLELWIHEDRRILYSSFTGATTTNGEVLSFTPAGLHRRLHFKPEMTTVGIVSCGGLCPGLNDVIRGVVYQSLDMYNVKRVIGFRYGFFGLTKEGMKHTVILDHQMVSNANLMGGTILGSSRGPQDPDEMVNTLVECQVDILICIGGDGTQRGALGIAHAVSRRGLDIGVVGIPKTIDNDIAFIDRTFGFDTAVSQAVQAMKSGLWEAKSHLYGVGLVKLMGRHAGFIAAQATLSSQAAQICLIPEHEVSLETIYQLLERRFKKRTYCVIVVAEGFGQQMLTAEATGVDKSGNKKLGDIGIYLRDKISAWLSARYPLSTLKYIDPSYIVRSCPASSNDAAFCVQLANCAVHEAMYGTTGCIIGHWAGHFTAVPTALATKVSKRVDLQGILWRSVREVTVSKRLNRLGAAEEDDDMVNVASHVSSPSNEHDGDSGDTVTKLGKRVQELERMIEAIKAREVQKDSQMQRMREYTSKLEARIPGSSTAPRSPEIIGDMDDGNLLELLEAKYARMKERMYNR